MCRYSFNPLFLFFFAGFSFVFPSMAQTNTCDLQIKTFSYNALPSAKSFIENVEITVTNLRSKEKKVLTTTLENTIFENLVEGKYKVNLVKKGYKKKVKEINLECNLADGNNDLYENIYLWKDEKVLNSSEDLREYKSEIEKTTDKKSEISSKKVYGKVTVRVLIDEDGNVTSAKAVDGNELLKDSSIKAARRAKFLPTLLAGMPVEVTGDIVYNFVP